VPNMQHSTKTKKHSTNSSDVDADPFARLRNSNVFFLFFRKNVQTKQFEYFYAPPFQDPECLSPGDIVKSVRDSFNRSYRLKQRSEQAAVKVSSSLSRMVVPAWLSGRLLGTRKLTKALWGSPGIELSH
jgi:hypothetical protein